MLDHAVAVGLPMLYAAMFSAPSDAIEGVKQYRHSSTASEKYEAIKALGPLYIERRKLMAGNVVEITKLPDNANLYPASPVKLRHH
jgi:hypothetical protein